MIRLGFASSGIGGEVTLIDILNPWPDDLVTLVRGGQRSLDAQRLVTAARNAEANIGLRAVSVFADLDRDLETLCRAKRALRIYGTLWIATAGRVRAAGFQLEQTGKDASHHSLRVRLFWSDFNAAWG